MRSLARGRGPVIPVAKRRRPGDPAHRRIGDDLLASEQRLVDVILTAVDTIPNQALVDAVETGNLTRADEVIRRALVAAIPHVERELHDQFVTSGRVAALELADQLRRDYEQVTKADAPTPAQIAASFRFGELDPRGLDWIRRESGDLITNMVRSEQLVFRNVVEQAYQRNEGLRQSIRPIFDQLRTVNPSPSAAAFASTLGSNLNGLTVRYEQAVLNRVGSLAVDLQSRGITGKKAVDQMRREADRYSTRLRRARAQTIARTERMRAHNQARLLSFQQAIESGLVRADLARKVWSTGVFDVCDICSPMQGQERLVTEPFTLPNGSRVMNPPGHPNCRCTMQMRTSTALSNPAQIGGSNTMLDPMTLRPGGMSPQAQQLAQLDFPDPTRLVDDILDEVEPIVDTTRVRRRVRYAADDPDIVAAAAEVGVSPDEMVRAVAEVPAIRRAIRDQAAQAQFEVSQQFKQWGVTKMDRPTKGVAEYDWFPSLSRKEQQRLRSTWMEPNGFGPDDVVAIIRSQDDTLGAADFDEILDAWLDATRRYDALGAIRRGKMPTLARYSGELDVNRLLIDWYDDGFRIETILTAPDDLAVAKHIVVAQRDAIANDAYRQLGDAALARYGQPAWRMSFTSFEAEVRELEEALREAALARLIPDPRIVARHRELVPSYLDIGQDFEDLYALIVDTARTAGLDVSDAAVIPWRVVADTLDPDDFDDLVRYAEELFDTPVVEVDPLKIEGLERARQLTDDLSFCESYLDMQAAGLVENNVLPVALNSGAENAKFILNLDLTRAGEDAVESLLEVGARARALVDDEVARIAAGIADELAANRARLVEVIREIEDNQTRMKVSQIGLKRDVFEFGQSLDPITQGMLDELIDGVEYLTIGAGDTPNPEFARRLQELLMAEGNNPAVRDLMMRVYDDSPSVAELIATKFAQTGEVPRGMISAEQVIVYFRDQQRLRQGITKLDLSDLWTTQRNIEKAVKQAEETLAAARIEATEQVLAANREAFGTGDIRPKIKGIVEGSKITRDMIEDEIVAYGRRVPVEWIDTYGSGYTVQIKGDRGWYHKGLKTITVDAATRWKSTLTHEITHGHQVHSAQVSMIERLYLSRRARKRAADGYNAYRPRTYGNDKEPWFDLGIGDDYTTKIYDDGITELSTRASEFTWYGLDDGVDPEIVDYWLGVLLLL